MSSNYIENWPATKEGICQALTIQRNHVSDTEIVDITCLNTVIIGNLDFDWMLRRCLPWEIILLDSMTEKHDLIMQWLVDNCTGRYYQNYHYFRFQEKEDAVQFKLVWV